MPGIRPHFQSRHNSSPSQEAMVAFLDACASGDVSGIVKFLDIYPRQTGVHRAGKQGLMYAAEHGHLDAVKTLLERGAEIHAKDEAGYSVLSYAVANGHRDTVLFLLSMKAGTGVRTGDGRTLLHLAAAGGHEGLMDLFPNLPLETKDKDGMTALSHAVREGHEGTVRFLLDRGAALDATVGDEPLLDHARRKEFKSIVRMLEEEPERRRQEREQEIDAALSSGTSAATKIKTPLRLLKEPRQQQQQPPQDTLRGGVLGAQVAARLMPAEARAAGARAPRFPFS